MDLYFMHLYIMNISSIHDTKSIYTGACSLPFFIIDDKGAVDGPDRQGVGRGGYNYCVVQGEGGEGQGSSGCRYVAYIFCIDICYVHEENAYYFYKEIKRVVKSQLNPFV